MGASIDFLYLKGQEDLDDKSYFLDYAIGMIDTAKYAFQVRNALDMTQEEFAFAMGCTKGNVSAWENKRHQPKLRDLQKMQELSKGMVEPPVELLKQLGEAAKTEVALERIGQTKEEVQIPLLSATASMGQGNDLVYEGDQIIGLMPLSKEWIHRNIKAPPDALRVITGAGDSMEPTFGSGDMLLVDTSKTVIDIDGVYVLSAHNRLFIKRVRQRMSGDFEISSDNPTVKTVDILNGDNPVTVHGRVVWAWNGRSM